MDDPTTTSSSSHQPASLQFSLRAMLVLTAVVAVACGLLLASPVAVRLITAVVLLIVLPVVPAAVFVYGRRWVRSFALGALCPALALAMGSGLAVMYFGVFLSISYTGFWEAMAELDTGQFGPAVLVAAVLSIYFLCGLLGVAIWRMLGSPARPLLHQTPNTEVAMPDRREQ